MANLPKTVLRVVTNAKETLRDMKAKAGDLIDEIKEESRRGRPMDISELLEVIEQIMEVLPGEDPRYGITEDLGWMLDKIDDTKDLVTASMTALAAERNFSEVSHMNQINANLNDLVETIERTLQREYPDYAHLMRNV